MGAAQQLPGPADRIGPFQAVLEPSRHIVAFFGRTDMEIRLRVLEGRRSRLQERLERVQKELAMTQKEVDRYAAELQRHGVEQVEREVRWLSELINAERNGTQPTAEADPLPNTGQSQG